MVISRRFSNEYPNNFDHPTPMNRCATWVMATQSDIFSTPSSKKSFTPCAYAQSSINGNSPVWSMRIRIRIQTRLMIKYGYEYFKIFDTITCFRAERAVSNIEGSLSSGSAEGAVFFSLHLLIVLNFLIFLTFVRKLYGKR